MKIAITKQMVDEAVSNVNNKLSIGNQRKKVYSPNGSYYLNNLIGELGELSFAKAIKESHILGVCPHKFDTFMNSDICDFYTSKTGKTIDVKTTHHIKYNNLLITKSIADWRPVYAYVLVKLIGNIEEVKDIYSLKEAVILGSITDKTIKRKSKIKKIHGKEVYFTYESELSPISQLINNHFIKVNEQIERYYPQDSLTLEVVSLEKGTNGRLPLIDKMTREYCQKNKGGEYNVVPFNIKDYVVSFSIRNEVFYTSLFIKALLDASFNARLSNKTLIIPDYIEDYIPKKYYDEVIKIIDELKCEVYCTWGNKKYY